MEATEPIRDVTAQTAAALHDYRALLDVDVAYEGWESQIANKTLFYIRGYTWFVEHVLKPQEKPISRCFQYVERMKAIIAERQRWNDGSFDWSAAYNADQAMRAVSDQRRQPIMFDKAVQTVVLFEAMAEPLLATEATQILGRIRIEAAASYINDFTPEILAELERRDAGFLQSLKDFTAQRSVQVFTDMAQGVTVTHKLAKRVKR